MGSPQTGFGAPFPYRLSQFYMGKHVILDLIF